MGYIGVGRAAGAKRDERISLHDELEARRSEAREIFLQQARSLQDVASRIDDAFIRATRLMLRTEGHVVVLGIGKSGLVGRKIAATFASTGTPSFFIHAAEAFHGDLGMITDSDTAILVSYSGRTKEVVSLLPHLRRRGIPTIAIVGDMGSELAKGADVTLDVSVGHEVCPLNLAPTSSTLATLAMGDALAVVLMRERRFRTEDFAELHPGGTLGQKLNQSVRDVMHAASLPLVCARTPLADCLLQIAAGRLGIAIVVDDERRPIGMIGHADISEAIATDASALAAPCARFVRGLPPSVPAHEPIESAEHRMRELECPMMIVVDADGAIVGILEHTGA